MVALAREAGLDPDRPLPFRVRATAVEATLHVLDKRDGLAHNPERHEQAKVRRTVEDAPVELVGFYSRQHRGIFPPGESNRPYQRLFRNLLVSPDILGVSTGAALGATLGIYFSWGVAGIQGLAFALGLTAVAAVSTHDPDHAFLCAHQVALLHLGRLARLGPPVEVLTRESLGEVYGVEVTVMEVAGAEGRVARVCVPALGATGRGVRPGRPS